MSRCFPFPPPGYERKTTIDNAQSLTKENHKEKDKKRKRDKEKREDKERKHKDRSKEKHGEKKDRKEDRTKKDKDRDKKKDRDRNKDKSRTSSEKILGEQTSNHYSDNYDEISQKAGPSKGFKSTEEFDSRIKERTAGNEMVENVAKKSLARHAGMGGMAEKERATDPKMDKHLSGHEQRIGAMGNMLVEGTIKNMVNNFITVEQRRHVGTSGMVEKDMTTDANMDTHLVNEERVGAMGNMVERASSSNAVNFVSAEQRRLVGMGRVTEKDRGTDTKMGRNLIANQRRTVVVGNTLEGANGNNMVNNHIIAEQRRDIASTGMVKERGMDIKMVKDANGRIEEEGKTKDSEVNVKKKEQQKDKDQVKSSRKKDIDKTDKIKDRDKTREMGEHEGHESTEAGKKEQDASSVKPFFPPQDTDKCASFDGNLKRKQINGFLYESDFELDKLPRMASFSHLPIENGRKLETHQIAAPWGVTPCTSDRHGGINNTVLERIPENRGHKTNGAVKSQPTEVAMEITPTDASKICDVSVKPHPDSKYLGQILSVPKMEEWSETVDQEWLFGGDDLRRKPSGKTEAAETPQVWAKALKIDEVLALPYVIPY